MKKTMYNALLLQGLILFFLANPSSSYFSQRKTNTLNLYGLQLEDCSWPGTAAAGFIEGPKCIHFGIDDDSHNICLDIPTVEDNDFCDMTGQENWCNGTLPCTENPDELCPVRNFCVRDYSFSAYLERAGGCDRIGHIKCEATNMMTILDYEERISVDHDMSAAYALDCIKEKCQIL
jgi:hypothetical protein